MKKYLAHILFIAMFSGVFLVGGSTASAATVTWDGGGDGTTWADGTNWDTDTAPVDGDDIVFTNANNVPFAAGPTITLTNDIPNLSVNSITKAGDNSAGDFAEIELVGNAVISASGIDYSTAQNWGLYSSIVQKNLTGDESVATLDGYDIVNVGTYTLTLTESSCGIYADKIEGSGSIIVDTVSSGFELVGNQSSTFSGSVVVNSGIFVVQSDAAIGPISGVTVNDGGSIGFVYGEGDDDHAFPITLSGNGYSIAATQQAKVITGGIFGWCGGGGGNAPNPVTLRNVNLSTDATFTGGADLILTDSYTNNGNTFSVMPGSTGNLVLPSGLVESEATTVTIGADDKSTAFVNIGNKQTVVLNGERGSVTVLTGGILKGTGKAERITFSGGTVAPGLSPGCLTTDDIGTFGSGFLQIELAGLTACTEYDQLVVNATATAVDITGVTLDLQHLGDFTTTADDQFVIVRNLSTEAVTGEFVGMAENSTFVANGMTYRINYNAGEGENDIVLTRIVSPGEPDSGLGPIGNLNTVWALTLGAVLLAGSGVALAKRS